MSYLVVPLLYGEDTPLGEPTTRRGGALREGYGEQPGGRHRERAFSDGRLTA